MSKVCLVSQIFRCRCLLDTSVQSEENRERMCATLNNWKNAFVTERMSEKLRAKRVLTEFYEFLFLLFITLFHSTLHSLSANLPATQHFHVILSRDISERGVQDSGWLPITVQNQPQRTCLFL